ncbi:hypothetical protein TSOC_000503 [Tetrabaena socialis]|uniref:Uncharacterized protein n=1 Tax=Tetrabaena socialis TaxID=47790 RepID=A0A2J8AJ49_9CHLO|nr:hypothetical protein TSOC_000503 [Tetrabaena socialis]|eukprot:PNH12538.1 hypothetical protein TSOC_000503 [Tetrabaena socialis]
MTCGVFKEMRAGATGAKEAEQEALEELEFELLAAAASTTTVADDATITAVKMKLNSFCKDSPRLRSQIQALVLSMNRLLGEAYAFATFHILHLHDCGMYPAIDRNFFYRCLVAVSANNSRPATLGPELVNSRDVYHALRPLQGPGSQPVNTVGYAQVLADLSIVMATMAGNHLWENLEKRIFNYLKMKYPGQLMGTPLRRKVVEALVRKPLASTADLFQLSPSVPPDSAAAERLRRARVVADELRVLMPLPNGDHDRTRAHLTLPLYIKMLLEIEEARAAAAAAAADLSEAKTTRGRVSPGTKLFTLLPQKAGFTISHIPISSMTMMDLLKRTGLSSHKHDGRHEDSGALWRKHFAVNRVETRRRLFGNRIVTDGCAVSVVMREMAPLIASCPQPLSDEELARLLATSGGTTVGVDPGVTDVATIATLDGRTRRYSSARYYERSKINLSNRRTRKWNAETQGLVEGLPSARTASIEEYAGFVQRYLVVLPELLQHRAAKGYRNMRFLRYVHRQESIHEICEVIAPREGGLVVVGFGDWRGVGTTPIRRRCSGPLQDIKKHLQKQAHVRLVIIDEYLTSRGCHGCLNRLTNMRAAPHTHGPGKERVQGATTQTRTAHCPRAPGLCSVEPGGASSAHNTANPCGVAPDAPIVHVHKFLE